MRSAISSLRVLMVALLCGSVVAVVAKDLSSSRSRQSGPERQPEPEPSEWEWVAQHALARAAAGKDPTELHGVDAYVLTTVSG